MLIVDCGVSSSDLFVKCGYACDGCDEDRCEDSDQCANSLGLPERGYEGVPDEGVDDHVGREVKPVDRGLVDRRAGKDARSWMRLDT